MPPLPRPTVTAVAAAHRVARRSEQDILVETEIELLARGRAPSPGGPGVVRPGHLGDAGRRAGADRRGAGRRHGDGRPPAGPGRTCCALRRWAAAGREEAGAEVLSLPINPTPTARLIVDPPGDGIPQGDAVDARSDRAEARRIAGRPAGPGRPDRRPVDEARAARRAARTVGPRRGPAPLGRDPGRRPAPRAPHLSRTRRDRLGPPGARARA